METKNTRYYLIAFVFAIIGFLMFVFMGIHQSNERQTVGGTFSEYYSSVDYSLKGIVKEKKLIRDYGTEYRNIYLVTIDVSSFVIIKDEIAPNQPFFGIFNYTDSLAYFVSPIYDENPDTPLDVYIDSKSRKIKFSNGLELEMIISDRYKELNEKNTANSLKF